MPELPVEPSPVEKTDESLEVRRIPGLLPVADPVVDTGTAVWPAP